MTGPRTGSPGSGPRFSVHTALWTRVWGEDLAPHIERAAALGFDGAEVSLLGVPPGSAARLARVAADHGVAVKCTTGLSAQQDISSADGRRRRKGIEYLMRAADTVAEAGADLLTGVISAAWGGADGGDRAGRWGRATEGLASVAPRFAERGITLGIEAVNRFETDLVTTADDALAMVRSIGAPNVGVQLDTFHMNIEERSIVGALTRAGAHLVHLHVAESDRGVPGTGQVDWAAVATGLERIGYRGWLGLELFVRAQEPVSADLRTWRALHPDPTAAAAAGLAFARGLAPGRAPGGVPIERRSAS